jgi:hypothetical protein
MGRHSKKPERPILTEVVTSLPGFYHPTRQLPPDDLSPQEFVEVSTGDDTPGIVTSRLHTVIGVVFWGAWVVWTIWVWFFTGAPFTDLGIAFLVWLVTFVITLITVPVMRRKARNRVRV